MELADPNVTSAKALSILEYHLLKDYYSTYATRISGFSAAELQQTAQRVFSPGNLNVIVVGDASAVKTKLERFGRVDVYDLDLKYTKFSEEKLRTSSLTLDQVIDLMYKGVNKPALEKVTSREIVGEQGVTMTGDTKKGAMKIV